MYFTAIQGSIFQMYEVVSHSPSLQKLMRAVKRFQATGKDYMLMSMTKTFRL